MRRVVSILLLEIAAAGLAVLKWMGGVRTDEAKYFLNIPYPHPPLVRTMLHWTVLLPGAELVWRVVFATLLFQGVWLLWRSGRAFPRGLRILLAGAWLTSAATILQTGTVMMAPLTALFGLVLVCHLHRNWSAARCLLLALLWLTALFTAYQALLYLPLLVAIFRQSNLPRTRMALYTLGPVAVLALYTLTNPLAIASMTLAAEKDAPLALAARFRSFASVWIIAGSGVFSVLGTMGILLSRRGALILSALLVCAFILLSNQPYYAILLTPLFVFGCHALLIRLAERSPRLAAQGAGAAASVLLLSTAVSVWFLLPVSTENPARDVLAKLTSIVPPSVPPQHMLIVGNFGHEWQYYAPYEVLKDNKALQNKQSDIAVCLTPCGADVTAKMKKLGGFPVEVYVRE